MLHIICTLQKHYLSRKSRFRFFAYVSYMVSEFLSNNSLLSSGDANIISSSLSFHLSSSCEIILDQVLGKKQFAVA